jgi:hypothetical protein
VGAKTGVSNWVDGEQGWYKQAQMNHKNVLTRVLRHVILEQTYDRTKVSGNLWIQI